MLQLGGLDALVPSLTGKTLVTLVTLAVVLATWRAVERLHDHDTDTVPRTLRHFGLSAASVLVTAAGGLVVIAVWGLTGPLVDVFESYSLGPETVVNAVLAIIILATAYGTTDLVGRVTRELTDSRHAISEHQREILYRLSQVSIYVVALSVVLGLWGVDLGGLLVGAGFLGIVVGLAARQTLGALLAGFVLMFSRPFEIGDWIVVGDDQEGVVTDITIINTRLENFDGEFIVIPNDKVADSAVTNKSQKGRLRLRIDVGIDYEADPEFAETVALEAIEGIDTVTETPPPKVFPKSFGDSAVVLECRFWIERPTPPKKWRTQAAVVNAVKTAFDREGIKIPYPQRELSGRAETGGFRISEGTRQRPTETVTDGRGDDDA